MTPDLRVSMDPAQQPKVLDEVCAAWADFPQSSVDGVRIDMPGGWALVRSSVTEAALTFRFEGLDWHALEDLVERFCDALPEVGDELWMRYRAAMGGEG
jgi:phosphomannomutase